MPLRKRTPKEDPKLLHAAKLQKSREVTPTNGHPKQPGDSFFIDLKREKDFEWQVEQIKRQFQHKKRTIIPSDLKPTLATIVDEAFNDEDWQFEIKWDGYRSVAYVSGAATELRSRNNLSFNKKFAPVAQALQQWPINALVDGEVVVLGEDGRSNFAALQAWDKEPDGHLLYYVFDLLWIEGIDLRKEPLSVRREVLKKIIPDNGTIRFSECIDE